VYPGRAPPSPVGRKAESPARRSGDRLAYYGLP
jgi:hypothetical protein